MSARYIVREGSPGGERVLAERESDAGALMRRDELRAACGSGRLVFDAIDTHATDPPESGELEWCERCGIGPVLASAGECFICEPRAELERNRSRPCPRCGAQMVVDGGEPHCAACGHEGDR